MCLLRDYPMNLTARRLWWLYLRGPAWWMGLVLAVIGLAILPAAYLMWRQERTFAAHAVRALGPSGACRQAHDRCNRPRADPVPRNPGLRPRGRGGGEPLRPEGRGHLPAALPLPGRQRLPVGGPGAAAALVPGGPMGSGRDDS